VREAFSGNGILMFIPSFGPTAMRSFRRRQSRSSFAAVDHV
jgi:polyhydroxyalkanoate synthesis regulator protein